MRDEQSPWSDNLIDEDDGAASMSVESPATPIFENNFLQRWIDRKGPAKSKPEADNKQANEPESHMGDGFHNVFPAVANMDIAEPEASKLLPEPVETTKEVKGDVLEQKSKDVFHVPHEQPVWDPEPKSQPETVSESERFTNEHKKDVVINATKNSGEIYLSHTDTNPERVEKKSVPETLNLETSESNNKTDSREYEKPSILERQFDDESGLNNIGEQFIDDEVRETDFDIKHEAMDDAGITNQGHAKEVREYQPFVGTQDSGPVPIGRVIEQKRQNSEPLMVKSQNKSTISLSRLRAYDYSILTGVKLGVITAIIGGLIYLIR